MIRVKSKTVFFSFVCIYISILDTSLLFWPLLFDISHLTLIKLRNTLFCKAIEMKYSGDSSRSCLKHLQYIFRKFSGFTPWLNIAVPALTDSGNYNIIKRIISVILGNRAQYKFFELDMFIELDQQSTSRKQPIFRDATTGFPAKWRLRNERRNSILMTCHYPDLGGASDWSCRVGNLIQPITKTKNTKRSRNCSH